jgi:hypothetical protein
MFFSISFLYLYSWLSFGYNRKVLNCIRTNSKLSSKILNYSIFLTTLNESTFYIRQYFKISNKQIILLWNEIHLSYIFLLWKRLRLSVWKLRHLIKLSVLICKTITKSKEWVLYSQIFALKAIHSIRGDIYSELIFNNNTNKENGDKQEGLR